MQPTQQPAEGPKQGRVVREQSYFSFRPEAVQAYSTRQAGEPWDAKHRLETLIIILLTLGAGAGLAFIFLGAH